MLKEMFKKSLFVLAFGICVVSSYWYESITVYATESFVALPSDGTPMESGTLYTVAFTKSNNMKYALIELEEKSEVRLYYGDFENSSLIEFTLLNEHGLEMFSFSAYDEQAYFGLDAGTYKLKIEWTGYSNQVLSFGFWSFANEHSEVERNNTFSVATKMEYDAWYNMLTYDTYDDKDYYYLNAEAGDELSIWVDGYEEADKPLIYLYYPDRNEYISVNYYLEWNDEQEMYAYVVSIPTTGKYYLYTYATNSSVYRIAIVNSRVREEQMAEQYIWFAEYNGCSFFRNGKQEVICYDEDINPIINEFKCDGTYTYYFQADGTAMRDRLTYHPDGEHVIYFDKYGHEVFSNFANVKKTIAGEAVDDFCFFDVNGYLYVDVVTYDKEGKNLYYANPYGVMDRGKWFEFSETVKWADGTPFDKAGGKYGYANENGTLLINTWTTDWQGRQCYLQGNGVALY